MVQIFAGRMAVNDFVRIGSEMTATSAQRGRPRSFDRDEALRRAQALIWRHGYEAMSLSQLEAAMGIGKTSLYAAFGSKLGLLREAAELYLAEEGAALAELLESGGDARSAIAAFLTQCAVDFTDPRRPNGCFLVCAAFACSEANAAASNFLSVARGAVQARVLEHVRKGVETGDLPADCDPEAMTEYLMTVIHGMSIQARDGRGEAALRATAKLALRALG